MNLHVKLVNIKEQPENCLISPVMPKVFINN